jgi:hypothetical protein
MEDFSGNLTSLCRHMGIPALNGGREKTQTNHSLVRVIEGSLNPPHIRKNVRNAFALVGRSGPLRLTQPDDTLGL